MSTRKVIEGVGTAWFDGVTDLPSDDVIDVTKPGWTEVIAEEPGIALVIRYQVISQGNPAIEFVVPAPSATTCAVWLVRQTLACAEPIRLGVRYAAPPPGPRKVFVING